MSEHETGRMPAVSPEPARRAWPPADLRNLLVVAHAVYALHAFAVLSALAGSATVLGSFLASIPSIAAVVLNLVKRSQARGSWLDSHYRWQLRTFWFALLWVVIAFMLILSVIGLFFGLGVLLATTFWVIYRIVRGWWRLGRRAPMPMPPESERR